MPNNVTDFVRSDSVLIGSSQEPEDEALTSEQVVVFDPEDVLMHRSSIPVLEC